GGARHRVRGAAQEEGRVPRRAGEVAVTDFIILCAAALIAGAQNSLAGGGTLYTFPTLQGILGSDVEANGTSTVALLPGSIAGAWGFRKEVMQTPGRILSLLVG